MSDASFVMTSKEAEELNRELALASNKTAAYIFVPAATTPLLRGGSTPKLHIDESGQFKHGASRSGQSASRRKSAPAARPKSAAEVPIGRKRSSSSIGVGQASVAQPPSSSGARSKRPKLQPQQSRASLLANQEREEKAALQAVMKPCHKLLKDLMRHPHARPFLAPVDPNLYSDYYSIIDVPIDLGTIKKKLEGAEYETPDEFAEDVQKVWSNAFLYNRQGTDVHIMAKQLQSKFEADYMKVPSVADALDEHKYRKLQKQMEKQMASMQRQHNQQLNDTLAKLQQTTELMVHMGQQMGGAPSGPLAVPQSAKRSNTSKKQRPRQPNDFPLVPMQPPASEPAYDTSRDMSFEEKRELSASINKLAESNLNKVVRIMKANMPSLGNDSEEFEVDFNALDCGTLWKLRTFVEGCKAKKKKSHSKKAPAQTTSSRMQALEQAKAAAEQRHSEVTAGLAALSGDGGGIMLSQEAGRVMDDDSPSDSESDGGCGGALVPLPSGAHGGNGAATSAYADYASSLERHKSERDESLRRSTEAARSAQERARHNARVQQLELERQRALERARHDADDNTLDMMGQSKAMNEFERHDDLSFGLDQYGGSGF